MRASNEIGKSAAAAFDGELHAGVAHEALQVLVFLGIEVLGRFKVGFGPLECFLDDLFVDLLFGDGVFGQNMNTVAFDFNESTTHGEKLGDVALGHAQFPVLDLREERNVARHNANLTLYRRDDDGVDRVGIDAGVGRDDFENKRLN